MTPTSDSETLQRLSRTYEQHQQRAQGLKPRTIRGYWRLIREFLLEVFGVDSIDIGRLSPEAVLGFISTAQIRFCPTTMRLITTSLRSFFRFLRAEGLGDPTLLEMVVPSVACRRLSNIPRGLTDEQLRRLILSLRTGSLCGYRDRAMVLTLSMLGIRPGELAELKLDDIDWRRGQLLLGARKTGRGAALPLPQEVGGAIVDYLREERPQTNERRVFVRHSSPRIGQAIDAPIVSCAVIRAIRRAGIKPPIAGAYVLRHTVANALIRRGTSLKVVADFLGHQHLNTTTIYAKTDIPALREVALAWPEVVR